MCANVRMCKCAYMHTYMYEARVHTNAPVRSNVVDKCE